MSFTRARSQERGASRPAEFNLPPRELAPREATRIAPLPVPLSLQATQPQEDVFFREALVREGPSSSPLGGVASSPLGGGGGGGLGPEFGELKRAGPISEYIRQEPNVTALQQLFPPLQPGVAPLAAIPLAAAAPLAAIVRGASRAPGFDEAPTEELSVRELGGSISRGGSLGRDQKRFEEEKLPGEIRLESKNGRYVTRPLPIDYLKWSEYLREAAIDKWLDAGSPGADRPPEEIPRLNTGLSEKVLESFVDYFGLYKGDLPPAIKGPITSKSMQELLGKRNGAVASWVDETIGAGQNLTDAVWAAEELANIPMLNLLAAKYASLLTQRTGKQMTLALAGKEDGQETARRGRGARSRSQTRGRSRTRSLSGSGSRSGSRSRSNSGSASRSTSSSRSRSSSQSLPSRPSRSYSRS